MAESAIHPALKNIPHPGMAEACNEMFIPGVHKSVYDNNLVAIYGDEPFPPVPTYFLTVHAAFLEETATGVRVRNLFSSLGSPAPETEEVADLYDQKVGWWQADFPMLVKATKIVPEFAGSGDAIKDWCIDTVRKSGRRLVAAHIIGRTFAEDQLIDALIVPNALIQAMPLLIRNAIARDLPMLDKVEQSQDFPQELIDKIRHGFKPILQGDSLSMFTATAVSSLMTESGRLRMILKTMYPEGFPKQAPADSPVPTEQAPTKMTRAEHRRQERQNKKKPD